MKKCMVLVVLLCCVIANVDAQNKVYFNKKHKNSNDSVGASFYRMVVIGESGLYKVSDYNIKGVLLSIGNTHKPRPALRKWEYPKVGQYVTFYQNRQVCRSLTYKNGKKEGVAQLFDSEGRVAQQEYYQADRLLALTTRYPNGNIEDSLGYTYAKRKVYYQLESYHSNGTLARLDKYESPDKLLAGECYDTLGVKCDYIPYLELPRYQGGEVEMNRFIRQNFKPILDAQREGVSGIVYVECTIDAEGNVKDASVTKGLSFLLDAEATRVVMSMPQWIPGRKKGVPCNMTYVVPVRYNVSELY
jgi:TonB family protein